MTNAVKLEIERLSKNEEDYRFDFQDHPDHEKAMLTIIDNLVENPNEFKEFKIFEEAIKIDSEGFPYINFTVFFKDGTEVEMTAYHDARWYYYARLNF